MVKKVPKPDKRHTKRVNGKGKGINQGSSVKTAS